MKKLLYLSILLFLPICVCGQYFLELHTEFDDSFREWEMVLELDSTEIEGELELTWAINNDFTEWQYRVESLYGEIAQKFNNNPSLWELRSDGKVVTIRQVWPGDFTEWKISYDNRSFVFRPIYANQLDEWSVKGDKYGELIMYTDRLGDPRDWIISDYMNDDITFEERMAAIFIALYSSIPKF